MTLYSKRGVSAQKEEVHAATKDLDAGLYPHAFCKLYPDYIGNDDQWVNVMHADGAGTKSILAYLYWKETGDISVWKGIAQDAIVMNLDDLLCVGIYDNIIFNSTIDRNKYCIPGEVLHEIISGSSAFFDTMKQYGINIQYLGGETADVGDVVRTIAVNGTMASRQRRDRLVTNDKIQAGDVIIGLASFGQCNYETEYNSGLGSNGLTSARHDVLSSYYRNTKESYDNNLPEEVVYIGKHRLTDTIDLDNTRQHISIGKLLLSPTRTYAPLIKQLLEEQFDDIHGLIHCSGGGQTKCLKYLPSDLHIVKDNLFQPPVIFQLIQESSGSSSNEMYQVFNMGCRMEIYTTVSAADSILKMADSYGIEAQVIGRVETLDRKRLTITTPEGVLEY